MADEELLSQWRNGNPEAARRLVTRYYPRMLNLFYRLTGTREVAEDLTQDLFVRLTHQVARDPAVANLDAWLHRTAMNLWRDLARREIRAREKGITPSGGDEALGFSPSPDNVEHAVMGDWLRDAVRQAVVGLSPPLREAIVLHHYQGLSYAAMASVLGIPEGTVRSRLYRAILQLRDQMDSDQQGGLEPWIPTKPNR
jgi:RNA polymerase sigma-70 factor (ECF subfamily)